MSVEQNKATLRRYYETVLNKGDFAKWDEFVDKDYVMHGGGQDSQGVEGGKRAFESRRTMAPDQQFTFDVTVAEGDMVAVRGVYKGTNTGSIPAIPQPTGKKFTRAYMAFYRFENGRIAEGWTVQDQLGQLRQLGITTIPTPAAASAR